MSDFQSPLANVHLALLHWPALNRNGEMVTTATTNLDIHDVARLSATYAVGTYWIVQPLATQRAMIGRIVEHWVSGPSAQVHPTRGEALGSVRVVSRLSEAAKQIRNPVWVATTAADGEDRVPVVDLADRVRAEPETTFVLCFGTGWGMAPQVLAAADMILAPIAPSPYKHLSVRSAISIYVDRLWQAVTR